MRDSVRLAQSLPGYLIRASRGAAGVVHRSLMRLSPGLSEKRISAMIRVRNEREFLYAAVQSIADVVDELVIVDNLSTDGTQLIVEALRKEYGEKLLHYVYPFDVRKVGRESAELASTWRGRRSPHLSATYYNWCLQRCTEPYVLKWDGDMIATERLYAALREWRGSSRAVALFRGANVHPDRQHLVAARTGDRRSLPGTPTGGMPAWVTSLTNDYPEPRLFPSLLARYDGGRRWTQELRSPFLARGFRGQACLRIEEPCYLHLKFCKRQPVANYSPDLAHAILANVAVGPPLTPEWSELLRRWEIGAPRDDRQAG